ncbi:hypothetical protein V1318_08385 [Lysobacter sp. CCNWLW3]|uniref:hypothetical protein n=2 Tax=Lysobacter TaxID=68 RepID=UPI002FD797D6
MGFKHGNRMKRASPSTIALSAALMAIATLIPTPGRAAAPSAEETTQFDVRRFVCPLGGAEFSQDVGYFSLALVAFADGSWLGDVHIDAQIPECPGNGLLLIPDYLGTDESSKLSYLDYTPEQLAQLPALLKSAEFRRQREYSRHDGAQWLATRLGLPAQTRWELLRRGSWATVDPAERKRRVTRLVDEGPALIDGFDTPEANKRVARFYVANALRELGRFDEAHSLLDSIVASLRNDPDSETAQSLRSMGPAIADLGEAIEARDDDRFPVGMSSDKWASKVCGGGPLPPPYGPMTDNARAACERRQQESAASAAAFQEAARLREHPEELERQCQATPEGQRPLGLAQACLMSQGQRDEKAGHELALRQAGKVAADCQATPQQSQQGPLFYACISFQTLLGSQLEKLLTEDDVAHKIVCADAGRPEDRASYATLACDGSERTRAARAVERLLADPKTLDAACATTPEQERGLALYSACSQRRIDLARADAERLAGDEKAYAAACAEIDARRRGVLNWNPSPEEQRCADAKRMRERELERAARAASTQSPPKLHRPIDDPPDLNLYHPDSGLNREAQALARKIVATAKAEGTYPKRQAGDRY